MAGVQWGNVAEWIGAIGTAGALGVALFLLSRERRAEFEERMRRAGEQASKVAAWVRWQQQPYGAWVVNASDQPVYDVVVRITATDGSGVFLESSFDVLPPESREECGLADAHTKARPEVVLTFRDNAGMNWMRHATGHLQNYAGSAG